MNQAVSYINSRELNTSLRAFAKDISINYEWLRKLRDGEIRDPGVSKIEWILNHANKHGVKTALKPRNKVVDTHKLSSN